MSRCCAATTEFQRRENVAAATEHSKPPASTFTALKLQRMLGNGNVAMALSRASPLQISRNDDPLELEADRVSRAILTGGSVLQRECGESCPCEACANGDKATELVEQVVSTAGKPLAAEDRAFFEPRFGYDFSNVRIHDDAQAAQSAQQVGAAAYTVGQHVVLGDSMRREHPSSATLAHELTHVIQQHSASISHLQVQRQSLDDQETPVESEDRPDGDSSVAIPSASNASRGFYCDIGGGIQVCQVPDIASAFAYDNCAQIVNDRYDECRKTRNADDCLAAWRCDLCRCVGPQLCLCSGIS
ncbi:MAG: DUF4157 domain-containing protein [Candidatus Eremiobacteraeota bacterium]|nr:DUF4157 domain-containing protein [Candidatus Eremiobacteraeota bacterium]